MDDREYERAQEIRRELLHELKHGKLSRRSMLRKLLLSGGALAGLSMLGSRSARADIDPVLDPKAPRTRPYQDALVHVNKGTYVKTPQTLTPEPTGYANTTAGGAAEIGRVDHQAWSTYWANVPGTTRRTYLLTQKPVQVKIHRDLPLQSMWGFDGKVPGPTFRCYYRKPCMVRIVNQLPDVGLHTGWGLPSTTTHLHNAHTPWESDGNPREYKPRQAELDRPLDNGGFRDHHYPNMYAGHDPREALGTLWYHDHRLDFTAPNVLRGLAGFYLMFDEIDSGNESDSNPKALRLPSGDYDVPLMLADVFVGRTGRIEYDQLDLDGYLGNKYMVNGKVQPKFAVEPRKYRLRLLNGSLARSYGLALVVSDSPNGPLNATTLPASVIATDGNLLPAPIPMINPIPLVMSQRLDVVVDFSKVPAGKFVYLVNRWSQTDGREPDGLDMGSGPDGPRYATVAGAGYPLMRFDRTLSWRGDPSRLPAKLRELPWSPGDALSKLSESDIRNAIGRSKPFPGVERVREWRFRRTANGQWVINDQLFDPAIPAAHIGKDTGEIWVLQSGGGWLHPVHIHLEEHRTLFHNGLRPGPQHLSYGRQDTTPMAGEERAVVYQKFRDFKGAYVMHCHNLVHEDHSMMIRFDVE